MKMNRREGREGLSFLFPFCFGDCLPSVHLFLHSLPSKQTINAISFPHLRFVFPLDFLSFEIIWFCFEFKVCVGFFFPFFSFLFTKTDFTLPEDTLLI